MGRMMVGALTTGSERRSLETTSLERARPGAAGITASANARGTPEARQPRPLAPTKSQAGRAGNGRCRAGVMELPTVQAVVGCPRGHGRCC